MSPGSAVGVATREAHAHLVSLDARLAQDANQVGLIAARLAAARGRGLAVRPACAVTNGALQQLRLQLRWPRPDLDAETLRSEVLESPLPQQLMAALEVWRRGRGDLLLTLSSAQVAGLDSQIPCQRVPTGASPLALSRALAELWLHAVQRDLPVAGVLICVAGAPDLRGEALSYSPHGAAGDANLIRCWSAASGAATSSTQALHSNADGQVLGGELTASGLTRQQLQQLVGLLRATQTIVDSPVEILWSRERGRIWLDRALPQRRGVYHVSRLGAQAPGLEVWSRFTLRENFPEPMSPLSFALWQSELLPIVFEAVIGLPPVATRERRMLPVDVVSGRLFWSANRLRATPGGALVLRLAHFLDRGVGRALTEIVREQRIEPPPLAGLRKLWALYHSLGGVLGFVMRALGGLRLQRVTTHYRSLVLACQPAPAEDLSQLDDRALLDTIRSALDVSQSCLRTSLAHEFLGAAAQHAMAWLDPARSTSERLVQCAEPGPPSQLARMLAGLANHLRRSGRLDTTTRESQASARRRLLAALHESPTWQAVLAAHGHRCARELDLAVPRWSENHEPLLLTLDAAVSADAEAAADLLDSAVENSKKSNKKQIVETLLRWLAQYSHMRELPGWAFAATWNRVRVLYLEVARRLVERGLLTRAQEIFLLEPGEIADLLLGLRRQVDRLQQAASAKALLLSRNAMDRPPELLRSDGLPTLLNPSRSVTALQGLGVGHALVEGVARVVNAPDAVPSQPCDVLVLYTFLPGMAPLLPLARALVTEVGDVGCHGACVARELGLPALVGVADACALVTDGQRVRVDTRLGTITLLDSG